MIALGCFLIAFLISYFGTLGLLRLPIRRGFIDVPNERSSHEAPKPRIGGIAIAVAFYAALAFLFVKAPETRFFVPLVVGSAMLFVTGVIDDWRGLGVVVRFAMHFAAAFVVVAFGITVDHVYIPAVGVVELGWVSVPLTVLFIVVSINFYNFIDGIDGLAAGSACIASGFLALIAMTLGHVHLALVFVAGVGCTLGFLQFNFPPSRLFMGDSGSTFLGFFFAYMAIAGNTLVPELPVFIPLLILSSLYVDAGLTLFNRIVKRENIFEAHHTHYYQRLLSLGLNHKQVTLLEYLLVSLLGASAIVYFKAGGFFPIFLSVCWFTLFTLTILKIRGLEHGDRLFWEKRMLFVIGLDLVLIAVAYLGAYFLRMNFRFTEPEGVAVLRALPIVLVVRSAVFYKFGLYRSVYKYTSTADIVRILKAVTLGSAIILTIVVLLYRFVAFPRTLFVIEFFLLTLLILGSRFSFRLFHEIGKEALGANVRRFGIIGAGDFGERVGRELRSNRSRATSIACYIDDDSEKIGMTLHGAPIVGPISRLREICDEYRLDTLALAISRVASDKMKSIINEARAADVPIAGRHSALWREPEPSQTSYERLSRGLGRGAVPRAGTPAKVFFRGKRVVLTDGGGPIGPALARELVALGASVTVQIDSAQETWRFDKSLRNDVFLYIGAVRDLDGWRSLLETASPDLVYFTTALRVEADSNVEEYLWNTAVVGTALFKEVLTGSGVSSVVMLSFWGSSVAGSFGSNAGGAAEAMILDHSILQSIDRKVVRVPAVFNSEVLAGVLRGSFRDQFDGDSGYAVLEPEAVTIALDCAASEPGRAVVVPVWDRVFSLEDAASILLEKSKRENLWNVPEPVVCYYGPTFPAETAVEPPSLPVVSQAQRSVTIDSPVSRPGEPLGGVLTKEFQGYPPSARTEWLKTVTAPLYSIAVTRTPAPAESKSDL